MHGNIIKISLIPSEADLYISKDTFDEFVRSADATISLAEGAQSPNSGKAVYFDKDRSRILIKLPRKYHETYSIFARAIVNQ